MIFSLWGTGVLTPSSTEHKFSPTLWVALCSDWSNSRNGGEECGTCTRLNFNSSVTWYLLSMTAFHILSSAHFTEGSPTWHQNWCYSCKSTRNVNSHEERATCKWAGLISSSPVVGFHFRQPKASTKTLSYTLRWHLDVTFLVKISTTLKGMWLADTALWASDLSATFCTEHNDFLWETWEGSDQFPGTLCSLAAHIWIQLWCKQTVATFVFPLLPLNTRRWKNRGGMEQRCSVTAWTRGQKEYGSSFIYLTDSSATLQLFKYFPCWQYLFYCIVNMVSAHCSVCPIGVPLWVHVTWDSVTTV